MGTSRGGSHVPPELATMYLARWTPDTLRAHSWACPHRKTEFDEACPLEIHFNIAQWGYPIDFLPWRRGILAASTPPQQIHRPPEFFCGDSPPKKPPLRGKSAALPKGVRRSATDIHTARKKSNNREHARKANGK